MTCEGFYADVQWTEEPIDEVREAEQGNEVIVDFIGKGGEELHLNLNDLMKKMQQMKSKNGQARDRMKLEKLISEYKKFKKNFAQHFRFNSAAATTHFGEYTPTHGVN